MNVEYLLACCGMQLSAHRAGVSVLVHILFSNLFQSSINHGPVQWTVLKTDIMHNYNYGRVTILKTFSSFL